MISFRPKSSQTSPGISAKTVLSVCNVQVKPHCYKNTIKEFKVGYGAKRVIKYQCSTLKASMGGRRFTIDISGCASIVKCVPRGGGWRVHIKCQLWILPRPQDSQFTWYLTMTSYFEFPKFPWKHGFVTCLIKEGRQCIISYHANCSLFVYLWG